MLSLSKGRYIKTTSGKIGILISEVYEYKDSYDIDLLFTDGEESTFESIDPDDIVDCQYSMLELVSLGDYINGIEVGKISHNELGLPYIKLINNEIISSDNQITNFLTLEEFNKNNISNKFIAKVEELNNEFRNQLGNEVSL